MITIGSFIPSTSDNESYKDFLYLYGTVRGKRNLFARENDKHVCLYVDNSEFDNPEYVSVNIICSGQKMGFDNLRKYWGRRNRKTAIECYIKLEKSVRNSEDLSVGLLDHLVLNVSPDMRNNKKG